jgi:flavin-dependent dehydrogenase
MYDVIIVGARCGGSPLAMLLARNGYRVALFDAATFPSDTVSTHLMWPLGVWALHRWGLWDAVAAAGPGVCHMGLSYQPGGTLRGPWHRVGVVDYTANLRRFKLDAILVDAARNARAEVREGVIVDNLLYGSDGRVTGVRAHLRNRATRFEEHARLVIGADGHGSTVARLVGSKMYTETPSLTATYYLYVADFPGDRNQNEIYTSPPREYLFSPTDEGLTVVNLVLSKELLPKFRESVTENFYKSFDLHPELGDRLRAARAVSRIRGVLHQPNFQRQSYGPGWALVGDAAYCRDPIRAQGMTDAFLDADGLAAALHDGLSGGKCMSGVLREHEQARLRRTAVPYDLCLRAARFEIPSPEQTRDLVSRIGDNPKAIAEMRGLFTGSMDPQVFYDPSHMTELIGTEGLRPQSNGGGAL